MRDKALYLIIKKLYHLIFTPLLVLCFLLVISPLATAQPITVSDLRIGSHDNKTRFVLDLSTETGYRVFSLDRPERIVIDLPSLVWQPANRVGDPTKIINRVRHGPFDTETTRIVLDLSRPAIIDDLFLLKPSQGRPYRLVVDLQASSYPTFRRHLDRVFGHRDRPETLSQATAPPEKTDSKRGAKKEPEAVIVYNPANGVDKSSAVYKPMIVIDAGHGGIDPGAIASNGLYEKKITLAAAKELKDILEKTGRFRVALTRSDDYYLKLHERVKRARKFGGDLFISLHADSLGRTNVRGASIYTLSDNASDKEAARLAERENKADAIRDIDLSVEEKDVADILIDLAMRDSMNQSKVLADTLIRVMRDEGITMLQNTHRYAGFAVLKAPDMPSVLIEMGFLSNPNEARRLSSARYRLKIARAIAAGLTAYFDEGINHSVF
mgnify:CR=1 FL=1